MRHTTPAMPSKAPRGTMQLDRVRGLSEPDELLLAVLHPVLNQGHDIGTV